jgi:hypothetical protein
LNIKIIGDNDKAAKLYELCNKRRKFLIQEKLGRSMVIWELIPELIFCSRRRVQIKLRRNSLPAVVKFFLMFVHIEFSRVRALRTLEASAVVKIPVALA